MEAMDYMPGKTTKKGIYISQTFVIFAVCALASSLLLVGLLCGLLPPDEICESSADPTTAEPLQTTKAPTEPLQTTRAPTEPPEPTQTPTPSTTVPPQPWHSLRLPGDVIPSHYDIELHIDIDDQQLFWGSIAIDMECMKSTDLLLVHSKNLTIDFGSASLTTAGGIDIDLDGDPWLYSENQYLVVPLSAILTEGEKYRFSISFSAQLQDGLIGLYRSSYKTAADETRYLATTFFAPTDARKAFPCFDEPAMKVTFNLTLIHQARYLALGNMPLLTNETESDGWVRSVFEKSVPMSTYLICFVVSDFSYAELKTNNNVTLRVWAREEAVDSVNYALVKGVEILDYYDEYFGTKFPLPKMDMIALPDFSAGAMENWGLITYREARLLYTDGSSSASDRQSICAIVAHELAHQWFGNLVTLEWWDDTWLNEGFASYVEYLGTDAAEPLWGMLDQFVSADLQVALTADSLVTSRPIIVDVETPDDIIQQFDTISYNKGASILRMLQNFLGESTFRKGLANYLKEYEYSNAKNSDLWRVLSEAAAADNKTGIDVESIMRTWTEQMNYPSVNIGRDYQSTSFTAQQSRFLINPEANTTTEYGDLGYTWHMPLRYTTRNERFFDNATLQWLNSSQDSAQYDLSATSTADDWMLANVDAYGFYRVNYDQMNWDLLSQQLSDDHLIIPISSRAALISDAFNLAQAGELSQVTAFNLTSYLDAEEDYVPWRVVQRVMGYVDLMLSRSYGYGSFSTYMMNQVMPFYNFVGWNDSSGTHLDQLGRVIAISLSCEYGNDDCVSRSIELYNAWMQDPTNNMIPANQRSTVYCTAIAEGGQEEWYHAFNQYENTLVATETSLLLSAMGCSKQTWILNMFLEMSIEPNGAIRSQDTVRVVSSVAYNPVGYGLAWDFFRTNWDYFLDTYGSSVFAFTDLIEVVTAHFNTELELNELLQFINDHPEQGTGSRALVQAVDQTRANIRWMNAYEEEIAVWLTWAITA